MAPIYTKNYTHTHAVFSSMISSFIFQSCCLTDVALYVPVKAAAATALLLFGVI